MSRKMTGFVSALLAATMVYGDTTNESYDALSGSHPVAFCPAEACLAESDVAEVPGLEPSDYYKCQQSDGRFDAVWLRDGVDDYVHELVPTNWTLVPTNWTLAERCDCRDSLSWHKRANPRYMFFQGASLDSFLCDQLRSRKMSSSSGFFSH